MRLGTATLVAALLTVIALPVLAQDQPAAAQTDQAAENLLSEAQLEDLLGPVALYPDTLLMQVLVASTFPTQVVEADQKGQSVADLPEADRKAAIEEKGYDPSVEVLAVAFPEVLGRMADNMEWTSTVGDAMLAQSDDVMNAIQVLRKQAIDTGALVDSPQQSVTTQENFVSSGQPAEAVVIQPTDPNTVYVPQYDPGVVYDTNRYGLGNALLTGAVAWGTFSLIDDIFDDDDDWNDYWGCRNCGGWYGNPIVRDPHVVFDGDRNVDFDRSIDINRDVNRNRTVDRDINRNIGWQPDAARRTEARDRLSDRRNLDTRKVKLDDRRGDELRQNLAARSGAADISRPENAGKLRDAAGAAAVAGGAKAGHDALKRSSARDAPPLKRPAKPKAPEKRPAAAKAKAKAKAPVAAKAKAPAAAKAKAKAPTAAKAKVQKPAAAKARSIKPASTKQVRRPTSGVSKPAIRKSASGSRTRAASHRGGASRARMRR